MTIAKSQCQFSQGSRIPLGIIHLGDDECFPGITYTVFSRFSRKMDFILMACPPSRFYKLEKSAAKKKLEQEDKRINKLFNETIEKYKKI